MRRRLSGRTLAVGLALVVAVIAGAALVPNLRADAPGASPAALRGIALKNDRAAAEAGARMRDESRATAEATDSLRAAGERGPAEAGAMPARSANEEADSTVPAAR